MTVDRIVLVRHGQTDYNAAGRLLGRHDIALNDVGRDQARAVARSLRGVEVARVVSSPLRRAVETAEMFDQPVEVDERWVEIDYGALDGVPLRDVPAEVWSQWRADPHFRPAGGESLADVSRRVEAACHELTGGSGVVVVVSHVSPIKAGVAWAMGGGPELTWRLFLDVASVSTIEIGERPRPVLRDFNVTP